MNKKLLLAIPLVVLVIIIVAAVFFLARNTSLLGVNIPPEEIEQNNSNPTIDNTDYTNLLLQTLIVPENLRTGLFAQTKELLIPEGFEISLFASGLDKPRFITFNEKNDLILTDQRAGKVLMLPDRDNDDIVDNTIEVDSNLRNPHGIEYYNGDLYVAEEHQVVVYRKLLEDGEYERKEVLIPDLPSGGGHVTRTIVIGIDEKIYLSIGSSCNLCEEEDERRASVMVYDLDGSNGKIYAQGLRNTVGLAFRISNLGYTQLWGVDMGRDLIGDDIPPEEVNILEEGKHYGWPYCYGSGIPNPEFSDRATYCENETIRPTYEMQAHSAPLGITFANSSKLPRSFMNNLFVVFHGSWNRSVPTGYKVVRIDAASTDSKPVNFISGWLQQDGKAWGRPVDMKFDINGDIFITDDGAGAVYKVRFTGSD